MSAGRRLPLCPPPSNHRSPLRCLRAPRAHRLQNSPPGGPITAPPTPGRQPAATRRQQLCRLGPHLRAKLAAGPACCALWGAAVTEPARTTSRRRTCRQLRRSTVGLLVSNELSICSLPPGTSSGRVRSGAGGLAAVARGSSKASSSGGHPA